MPTTPLRDDDGSTFIELLVVAIIIGVLAAIATTVFLGQRDKAVHAAATSDLRDAATAEEAQLTDSGSYTTDLAALGSQGFHASPGVRLGIAVSASGYCEVASTGNGYWWFDSAAGGVQSLPTATLTRPTSATGACQAAAPTSVS